MAFKINGESNQWPSLPFPEWKDTAATLHMWTQIVGKIRLTLSPWTNHSWHVTLYVTSRGLTTSAIPYGSHTFEVRFDFIDHQLLIDKSDGAQRTIELKPQSVARFYRDVMETLSDLELPVTIHTTPNEIENAIPFDRDEEHRSYDRDYANRFWRVLMQSDRVFKQFRSRFCGKCSPVHFFWGSFDLAVTRFSGRPAPPHPGGVPHLPDVITREAYSQEVSSLGFWPGNAVAPTPIFYSYAYPEPAGFSEAQVRPDAAFYEGKLREFILPYDSVRTASKPDELLLDFAQSAYDAASTLGQWDRDALQEKKPVLHSASQHS
ncbi:MAG TPA: DUF5996 family protein [Candidatus Udaeobacter sp.]|jgi:hypothetical protein|nr:DUF5996 family protein [Candidatus Udaeobacter sp.]